VLVALAAYGAIRLARTPTEYVADVRLRLMQPNLPQDEKFRYDQKQAVMKRYLELSDRATGENATGVRDVTHLIWPESAFPFFLTREPDAMAQIAALLPAGTVLITGAIRAPEGATTGQPVTRAYNSVYVIDHAGSVLSVYDKVHLVPFGEYLPFQALLESVGLMQLTRVRGGFIAGDRHRAMNVPRAPSMMPLVCYEIIFPGKAVPRGERPGWLLNLTNDGWFGASAGPYQHFQQSRIRAIEEGLPLVRVANTGISAVVDPLGRVITSLPLGTAGVLDARLPRPIPPTAYARVGDGPIIVLLGIAFLLTMRSRRRSRVR
jgi:apolipoprotein N-acyltransferase